MAARAFSCLEVLLAHSGQLTPGRKAILAPGRDPLTYGALWDQTKETVRALRRLGVRRGDRVAVVLPNGPEAAVAMVAVAAGAVCVPLNPAFTADEWQVYFGDLQIAALLTCADLDSPGRSIAHTLGIPVIDLVPRPNEGAGAFSLVGAPTHRTGDGGFAPATDDAFILLTSGTEARPKMVPLTHANVCLSAHNANKAFALGPRDRLLCVLPLFHAHGLISGLLTALAAGSSVVATSGFDVAAFFGWLTEFRPTWFTAVPTMHRALLVAAERFKHAGPRCSLRLIRSASSSLAPDVLGGLETLFGACVIECYGMTEAASQIAANPLRQRKPGSVGTSAGPEIAIMDGTGRRLRAGQRGEIALRGRSIARGYDNDPHASIAAFRNGWFFTGDLGYLDRDGYLFIIDRIKDIINRGGQKIAPGEVEEVLLSHPDVMEAVAFSILHKRLGEDVAAAVVLRPGAKIGAPNLRNFARERLARFKVPGLILFVPEIPKRPGGKIARGGLAATLGITAQTAQGERSGAAVAPRSRLERQLAAMWARLLEIDRIDVDQDLFALGADSLTIMQMISRLRARFGVEFSYKDFLDAPSITALAARLQSSQSASAVLPTHLRATRTDARSARLSFQQQRIHVLSRLDPTGCNYHIVDVVRLSGPLNVGALEASIAKISERHEVMRSTFADCAGELMQRVGTARPRLERIDIGPCAKSRRGAAIERQVRKTLAQPFELEREPPFRAQLVRLDQDDHALVITLHHLVTDGWSHRLFWEELGALYTAALGDGFRAALPKLSVQYRHFVEWQRAWLGTPAAAEQLRYWRTQLEGLTDLPLRTDRPRPEIWSGRGARYPFNIPSTLSRAIRALSRDHRVTLFMTLLAAFQCLLHRYTGHADIAIGSLIANRNQIDIEQLIGMFANTIVLRTNLSGDPRFSEVLQRVRQVTLDAYRNQDLPIEEVLRALQTRRSMDRTALFQVMFILQNASPVPALHGLSGQFINVDLGTARFDLTLELIDADERLSGWIEYSTDLFEAATIARMGGHLQTLLEAIVADPQQRISRLPLLPESERRLILVEWNDTRTSFPPGNFAERFARQTKRTPNAVAVSAGTVRLSYRELARRGSAIANRLVREGVGPDVVVVLLAERGVDTLAAIIGVQQAGGAFLPLDPTIPAARLAQILAHSRAPFVLVGRGCVGVIEQALFGFAARERPLILSLKDLGQTAPRALTRPIQRAPSNLAYVVYTSGSTGRPKGVMIDQRGLMNNLRAKVLDLELSAADVIAQTAPQSFNVSVWQFLSVLMVGGRVHVVADETVRDPALLVRETEREGLTVLETVPSVLRAMLDYTRTKSTLSDLSRLRWMIPTGEALPADLCRDWLRHFPAVPLINAYGGAECSDDVALHRITEPPPVSIATAPIGRPIANTRLYVTDAHLQPVPIGIVGELCVGGAGVGRGYLNDPEQTRRSFVRDPFARYPGARLYKTGDLARWCADGYLEFFGRVDHQVKIRGYRIELVEIEHFLMQHPEVGAAVVLARNDLGAEARLVAYIVAAERSQPETNALRDFLRSRLPDYMVPTGFIMLERLPLTANGKVDRQALSAMRHGLKVAGGEFASPRDSTEEELVAIWADLLAVEKVGILDDFFALGGHSLLAGRVLARVADAFGTSLPLRTLFEAPTVAALAARLNEARVESKEPSLELARVEEDGPRPVSVAQEHVLRIERELPGLPQFNVPLAYRLQGPLNVPAFERSLAEVVRRHDSLRMSFAWEDGQPFARVAPTVGIDSVLAMEELAAGAPTRIPRAQALLRKKAELRAEQEARTPFDMTRGPLFRIRLLRLGAEDHVLLLTLHHIIVDGWSIGVFMEEIARLYAVFVAGRRAHLPDPLLQFSDFARWQRSWCATHSAARQLAYWKEHLREVSPVFRAIGDPGVALLTSPIGHEPIDLPNALVAPLDALSRSQGGTLFMALLTGFKALLLARAERNDICVATPMANRSRSTTERMIGPLENTTLIRTRLHADLSFREALGCVRESVLEAHARQELPFGVLAGRLAEEDGVDPSSLVQVVFGMQNPLRQPFQLADIEVKWFGDIYRQGQPLLPIDHTWLTVMLKETPLGIIGSCTYKDMLFETDTLYRWMADYKAILSRAAADPGTPLGRLARR
jgi:amino acid adenylation domain-containing protein